MKASDGTNEWIPQDQPQEFKLIRRRLRKRKKRPPFIPDDGTAEDIIYRPLRRRVRPHRRNENQTPWDEVQEEHTIRPHLRRRIPPRLPILDETVTNLNDSKNDRDETESKVSESVAISEPTSNHVVHSPISDLKSILKQTSGTLSLSEILQQKNLSLTELLSGNEKAISALTEKPLPSTEKTVYVNIKVNVESKDVNNRVKEGFNIERNKTWELEIENDASTLNKNNLEVNRKRLVPNKIVNENMGDQITIESTTEKRIFVPSHPKYYTSLNFKPDFTAYIDKSHDKSITNSENPITGSTHTNNRFYTSAGKLPTTNAKLKQNIKNQNSSAQSEFPQPFKINLNDVIGFPTLTKIETRENNVSKGNLDKPLRIPLDLDIALEPENENVKTTTEIPTESTIYVTAREEIMEVLKDPSSREKLSRILEMRNMTIEELVQQRERGSSQTHLADIFHNKSREPEPREEVLVGQVEPGIFNPPNERQQKSRVFGNEKNVQNQSTQESTTTLSSMEVLHSTNAAPVPVPTIIQHVEIQTENVPWKIPYNDLLDIQENDITKVDNLNNHIFRDIQSLEDTVALSSSEKFNVEELQSHHDNVFFRLPSGVKSAIFVSLAIIGLSMVVFLTILVIFKWSQLKHRRINYCNSLTSKFRSPMILQGRPTAAIKSFVNETLGRRKSYYKNNVQRMCDDIWEGDKDRKLSF